MLHHFDFIITRIGHRNLRVPDNCRSIQSLHIVLLLTYYIPVHRESKVVGPGLAHSLFLTIYCGGLSTLRSGREANCRMGLLVVTIVILPSLADFFSVDHGAACFDGAMGCNSESKDAPLSYELARAKRLCSVSCSFAALPARSRCKNARGSSSGLPLRATCRRRQTADQ